MPFLIQGETKWKYVLIVAIFAVVVGGGILSYQYWWLPKREIKKLRDENIPLIHKEMCDPELSLFRSTGFLTEDQSIELVGRYKSDSLELIDYDPHPCLQWSGTDICSISYWEKDEKSSTGRAMRKLVCPADLKDRLPKKGGNYTVDRSCCFSEGDCSLVGWEYPVNQLCVVNIEDDPKLMKACFLLPIRLEKPLKNIKNDSLILVRGYLLSPYKFPGEKLRFIFTVDSYKELPIKISSEQAIDMCKKSLLMNVVALGRYCNIYGFSCDTNQLIKNITSKNTRLSTDEKWIVSIPIGGKSDVLADLKLNLNFVCTINPYSGNLIQSTTCSDGSCIRCE